jgi:tripartite-type tricarboxylate transporter receptor subunit TctC
MKLHRRPFLGLLATAALPAWSQSFPARPITLVVPYPPGASTDQTARLTAQRWTADTGHTVVVENRAGANGNVGSAFVAKSPPDGYRILLAPQPIMTINPFIYKEMGFDPVKELTPLTAAVNAVVVLVAHPSLPANNVAELIAYAKKEPEGLQYGTAGAGTPQHIAGLMLGQRAGFKMTHIGYRGGGPMVTDLLAGHIKLGIVTLSAVKAHADAKRLKVLAIGESTRFSGAPDLPTIAETIPGFELTTWLGFFGPGGLPPELVNHLSGALIKALNAPDVKAKLAELALPLRTEGPAALAQLIQQDRELYGRLIRENRITAD